jgi:hypothetical protein
MLSAAPESAMCLHALSKSDELINDCGGTRLRLQK